ncbi:hypothetical protein HORIV_08480 [Vreelandella olivaria]|uniref:Uncharacterized protein n=1 Tax=Vreelandella olivaria TaxID=390919 RepID=A0ABN5WR54_9GAMM|nr:hypothetical protein HORIV_08480 [Halomonas olivaria]
MINQTVQEIAETSEEPRVEVANANLSGSAALPGNIEIVNGGINTDLNDDEDDN